MPHLLIPGIRCPVSLLEHFKTLAFGHNTANPAGRRKAFGCKISNLEIFHADTPSAEKKSSM